MSPSAAKCFGRSSKQVSNSTGRMGTAADSDWTPGIRSRMPIDSGAETTDPLARSVVLDELDLHTTGLSEIRGVHPGEVLPMRRRARLHTGGDEGFVRSVDVVGAKAEVANVDLVILGRAQL